jgi:hypothetical protein
MARVASSTLTDAFTGPAQWFGGLQEGLPFAFELGGRPGQRLRSKPSATFGVFSTGAEGLLA